jgi:hypothetical protein
MLTPLSWLKGSEDSPVPYRLICAQLRGIWPLWNTVGMGANRTGDSEFRFVRCFG